MPPDVEPRTGTRVRARRVRSRRGWRLRRCGTRALCRDDTADARPPPGSPTTGASDHVRSASPRWRRSVARGARVEPCARDAHRGQMEPRPRDARQRGPAGTRRRGPSAAGAVPRGAQCAGPVGGRSAAAFAEGGKKVARPDACDCIRGGRESAGSGIRVPAPRRKTANSSQRRSGWRFLPAFRSQALTSAYACATLSECAAHEGNSEHHMSAWRVGRIEHGRTLTTRP